MKKIKNILFISNAIQFAERTYPFGKRLEKKGYKIQYATYSKECMNYFKERGVNATFILDDILSFNPQHRLNNYLEYYEKKYDIPSMNLLLLGDKNYSRKGRKNALIGLVQHFKFWEKYFKTNSIDLIIGGVERFINEVPRAIIKKQGGIHLSGKVEPLPNTFTISPDHIGRIYLLDKYWEENQDKLLTKEEREWAENYMKETIEKKKGVNLVIIPPAINLDNVKLTVKRFYINFVKEKMKNPYADLLKIAGELGARSIRKRFTKIFYEKPVEGEKFIYYPLHRATDAAILVRAPQYANQISFIQNISNHLPIRYKLYVKEHPNGAGETSLKELRKLKKMQNVRLLKPKISSHDLIEKADCTITINSNAGWEAMLHQKPVLTFGTAFYDRSGLVYPIRDFYKFNETLKKALNSKFDYEKLLKFIVALKKSVRPGNFQFIGKLEKSLYDEKNLDLVTEGIIDHIKEIEKDN